MKMTMELIALDCWSADLSCKLTWKSVQQTIMLEILEKWRTRSKNWLLGRRRILWNAWNFANKKHLYSNHIFSRIARLLLKFLLMVSRLETGITWVCRAKIKLQYEEGSSPKHIKLLQKLTLGCLMCWHALIQNRRKKQLLKVS